MIVLSQLGATMAPAREAGGEGEQPAAPPHAEGRAGPPATAAGSAAPAGTPHPADSPAPAGTPHPAADSPAPAGTPHPAADSPAPAGTPHPAAGSPGLPARPADPAGSESRGAGLLSLRHAAKAFGAVQALADGSVELRTGEAHGLVGENGAGK